ncbi:MAG: hypothetical protein JWN40_1425 [Phycisphaerales bacterium]|nr:hypothetical protein [Phycisphaerales bacterium]
MKIQMFVSLGMVAALSVLSRGDERAPATRPVAAATRAATTRAATTQFAAASRPATRPVRGEVAVARRMIDAGDPRIIPTLLWWLATEQDVPVVGLGSSRLQEAIRGVQALRVKEAVPWLIGVPGYEQLRQNAWVAAMRIDPSYSSEFVREQFENGRYGRLQGPAPIVAAVVLMETAKDEAAREFLLAEYRASQNARVAGRNAFSVFELELMRSADASLRDDVLRLASEYSQPEVREAAEAIAEQMRLNALPAEELAKLCEDAATPDLQRQMASQALAWRGTPDVLARLEKVAKPAPAPTAGIAAPVDEATTPAAAAEQIRQRHRLGKAAAVEAPRAPIPAIAAAEARPVVEGDAEGMLMRCMGVSVNPNKTDTTPYIGMLSYDGSMPLIRLKAANAEVLKASQALDYEGVVLANISPDRKTLLSIRALDPRPGELLRDGYVLVERCKVTDGKTERLAVRLSKFGRQFLARIPNRTGANGAVVSDSTLTRAVEGLTPGEVVEARFEESGKLTMLTRIAAYRPAVVARFLGRVQVRRGADMAPGIEVWLGARRRTFVLPPQDGPLRPALDAAMLEELMPGCDVRLTVEGDPMADGGPAQVLRDLRIDGQFSWKPGRLGFGVQARRASWNNSGSLSWNGPGGEAVALRRALARFSADKTNALGFAPETAAVLKDALQTLQKLDIYAARNELTPLGEALRQEGNPEKQDALEQRILLGLQRFVVGIDAKAEEQGARVKKILNEEQYKALLAFGAGRG